MKPKPRNMTQDEWFQHQIDKEDRRFEDRFLRDQLADLAGAPGAPETLDEVRELFGMRRPADGDGGSDRDPTR